MDGFAQRWVGGQLGDRGEAQLNRLGVAQRRTQPLTKASRSDCGGGVVDERDQRPNLQVANRGDVQRHGRVRRVRAHGQGLRSDPSLIGLEVLEHNARGSYRERCLCRADGGGITDSEEVLQALPAALGIESVLLHVRWGQQL